MVERGLDGSQRSGARNPSADVTHAGWRQAGNQNDLKISISSLCLREAQL